MPSTKSNDTDAFFLFHRFYVTEIMIRASPVIYVLCHGHANKRSVSKGLHFVVLRRFCIMTTQPEVIVL